MRRVHPSRRLLGLLGAMLFWPIAAQAITLASLFRDGAVLQRDRPVPIWGEADPGETVTVRFGHQQASTVAGSDGRWRVDLAAMPAESNPRDLVVSGQTEIVVRDVLVGEVWLASGQSNMEWPLRYSEDRDIEILAARWPLIREFKVERQVSSTPTTQVDGAWRAAVSDRVTEFSAVAYAFAKDLHGVLNVPVGIINSTYGGTPIIAWLPPELANGQNHADEREAHAPAVLYHGMIEPLMPYALRGFIWYQGESDAARGRAAEYASLFRGLISDWRQGFGDVAAPFYWAQLAPYQREGLAPDALPRLREAQTAVLDLPHTGQVITLDVGDAGDIHPKQKSAVGRRLARLALHRIHGQEVLESGPVVAGVTQTGQGFRVEFDHATGGLRTRGGSIRGFEIAGADRVFYPAEAKAEENRVDVTCEAVAEPAALRYAWRNAPEANLINRPGLPAAPFRTDDW